LDKRKTALKLSAVRVYHIFDRVTGGI